MIQERVSTRSRRFIDSRSNQVMRHQDGAKCEAKTTRSKDDGEQNQLGSYTILNKEEMEISDTILHNEDMEKYGMNIQSLTLEFGGSADLIL